MVGDPSDPILASIYAFGGHDFDTQAALTAMLRGATDPKAHVRMYPERPGLADYMSKGYIPESDEIRGSASVTLEDTNADFAIAQFAKAMDDEKTEQEFLKRSAYWRNIFDPDTKYIRARDANGKFLPDFTPGKSTGFVEGNSSQYTWMIPYDLKSVIPQPSVVRKRRSNGWTATSASTASSIIWMNRISSSEMSPASAIHGFTTGLDTRGARKKWSVKLLMIYSRTVLAASRGMTIWGRLRRGWLFANLGFYPEIPGVGGVTTNSPVFPRVKLMLGDHPLEIVATGAPEKKYVTQFSLDGSPIHNWWIDWSQLSKAIRLSSRCRIPRTMRRAMRNLRIQPRRSRQAQSSTRSWVKPRTHACLCLLATPAYFSI